MRLRRALRSGLALAAMTALAACGSGGGVVATENDRLRAQVLDLENQVKSLQSRNSELQAQLTRSLGKPESIPVEVAENTPHVTSISINRLSHARDTDGDGRIDSIILYLQPADGLGRFLQIVGTVSVHAAILPTDGPAKTIGQKEFGPGEVRDGYRSAFTGQYYSLTLPIAPPAAGHAMIPPAPSGATTTTAPNSAAQADSATQCTVRVEYTDGYTGEKFAAERVIDLR